jgi:glutamate---cysteine ligase / carboxylate-amine ligase
MDETDESKTSYHLFERFGVEMEYMIVDSTTLDVRPIADAVLAGATGENESSEAEFGRISWSNELVRHVLEFKGTDPEPTLDGLDSLFQAEVIRANSMLSGMGCRLMPTGMHPWMNPHTETVLWPYGNKEIYNTFDRIFNCKGHGWSNLQSTHINLPFCGDEEFHRLHSAIRIALPLLPAIIASTPFADGAASPWLDTRLETYRHNCDRVPSITAGVVPCVVASKAEYEEKILGAIYKDMEKLDPAGVLRDEWVNARGAIARFERDTVEIRVIDLQECPRADMAIVQYVVALVKALTQGGLSSTESQDAVPQRDLEGVFLDAIKHGCDAKIRSQKLCEALGMHTADTLTLREIHAHLLSKVVPAKSVWKGHIEMILRDGNLAQRILRVAGKTPSHEKLHEVYGRLADGLARGVMFAG